MNYCFAIKKFLFFFVSLSITIIATAQSKVTLNGKVIDDRSNPVAGASIHLLNTHHAALTDGQGNFSITNIFPGKYLVTIVLSDMRVPTGKL